MRQIVRTLDELEALPVGTVIAQFYPPTVHWPAEMGRWQAVGIHQRVTGGWESMGDSDGPYSSDAMDRVHLAGAQRSYGSAEPAFTVLYRPDVDLLAGAWDEGYERETENPYEGDSWH